MYVMNADGTGLRQLAFTEGTWVENDPAWSPDGTRVAFNRWQRDDAGGWFVQPIAIVAIDTVGVDADRHRACLRRGADRVGARRREHPDTAGHAPRGVHVVARRARDDRAADVHRPRATAPHASSTGAWGPTPAGSAVAP